MTFQPQFNNPKLCRVRQIEDSLETVDERLDTVTELDHSQ